MKLKPYDIELTSAIDGTKAQAYLFCCTKCHDTPQSPTAFIVTEIKEGHHMHLQCYRCSAVYCDGDCLLIQHNSGISAGKKGICSCGHSSKVHKYGPCLHKNNDGKYDCYCKEFETQGKEVSKP